jgi:hypothetical protein
LAANGAACWRPSLSRIASTSLTKSNPTSNQPFRDGTEPVVNPRDRQTTSLAANGYRRQVSHTDLAGDLARICNVSRVVAESSTIRADQSWVRAGPFISFPPTVRQAFDRSTGLNGRRVRCEQNAKPSKPQIPVFSVRIGAGSGTCGIRASTGI